MPGPTVIGHVEQLTTETDDQLGADTVNNTFGHLVTNNDSTIVNETIEIDKLTDKLDKLDNKHEHLARKDITSDGNSADYYKFPEGATEIQDLISFKNMNAQVGEMFRALYRYGQCSHSDEIREIKKVIFYGQAELARLEKYGE